MKVRMTFTKVSTVSKEKHSKTMMVDPIDLMNWQAGDLIQDALPYLSPAEREFLLTGITEEEWKERFANEPQEGRGMMFLPGEQEKLEHQQLIIGLTTRFCQIMEEYNSTIEKMLKVYNQGEITWEGIEAIEGDIDRMMFELMATLSEHDGR
jgi:hypothetical protein